MASKQSAKSNKMSDSESDGEQEIVEKKGVSKRKAAPAASSSKVTKKAANKRAAKVEPAQKKKEEPKQESDTEHESGSEESDGDQKVPLLDQPLELSGARDRKQVDRFNADLLKGGRRHYDIEIPAGKGTRLKDIPSISYELKKSGVDDLKTLHRIMYSRIGNVSNINQNILMFNGFSFDKNSIPYRRTHTALSKLNMNKLKSISQVLCLPKAGKQAHYIERILDFLLEPTDTGKAVRESRPERKGAHSKSYKEASADKEGGSGRGKKRGKTAEAKSEDDEHEDEDEDEDVEDVNNDGQEAAEEEPPAKKNKRGAANKKSEQEQDIENGKDEVEAEDKKSKKSHKAKQAKKRTADATDVEPAPVKETTSRKQNSANSKKTQEKLLVVAEEKGEKEDNGEEEEADKEEEPEQQPPNPEKKVKKDRPPTDDEIKAFVKTILDDANLEEITMKTVCKQVFEHFPDFDLSNKKEFIKVTVKSFIS